MKHKHLTQKTKRVILSGAAIGLVFLRRYPAFVVVAPALDFLFTFYWIWSGV